MQSFECKCALPSRVPQSAKSGAGTSGTKNKKLLSVLKGGFRPKTQAGGGSAAGDSDVSLMSVEGEDGAEGSGAGQPGVDLSAKNVRGTGLRGVRLFDERGRLLGNRGQQIEVFQAAAVRGCPACGERVVHGGV